MRKHRWRTELVFVIAVLVVLLAVMLPRFLKVQAGGQVNQIQNDLTIITEAIQAYINDYGYVSKRLHLGSRNNSASCSYYDQYQYHLTAVNFNDLNKCLSDLTGQGYIESFPPAIEAARKIGKEYAGYILFHLHTLDNTYNEGNTENWGIAVCWPHARRDKNQWLKLLLKRPLSTRKMDYRDAAATFGMSSLQKKLSELNRIGASSVDIKKVIDAMQHLDYSGPLISPKFVYHPTNGLESAGFVYVDTKGFRLP